MKLYYPKEILKVIRKETEKQYEKKYYVVKPRKDVTVEIISATK